jgi:TonB family protein
MNTAVRVLLAVALLGVLSVSASADSLTYQQAFVEKVTAFANLNRLNIARLNRDVHVNCYIPVTIATVILRDGSVDDISVVKSSTVPVVDRQFRFVIEQAEPYPPLVNHYDPAPETITITQEFKLDAQLWGHGARAARPCEEFEPLQGK